MSYNDNNPQLKESIRKSWRREMCASKVKKELWFKTLKHFCSQDGVLFCTGGLDDYNCRTAKCKMVLS